MTQRIEIIFTEAARLEAVGRGGSKCSADLVHFKGPVFTDDTAKARLPEGATHCTIFGTTDGAFFKVVVNNYSGTSVSHTLVSSDCYYYPEHTIARVKYSS